MYIDAQNIPRLGLISLDSADSASLVASGQFTDVVLHEMGHVLVRCLQMIDPY